MDCITGTLVYNAQPNVFRDSLVGRASDEATGIDQLSRPLDEGARLRLIFVCVCFLNRPVRTRMPGGVGRAD